jgi:hypothetical protein
MVPVLGVRLQVTAVLLVLATVAVNCCVWDGLRETVALERALVHWMLMLSGTGF